MRYWFRKTKEEAAKHIKDNQNLILKFVDTRIACEVNNNIIILSNHKL